MDSNFWNTVYQNKPEKEVSWFQEVPVKSLELIDELGLSPSDAIIDIGGGDSHLVDELLARRFKDISVLDISTVALEKAAARLGNKCKAVKFIASDITKFDPPKTYKLWHDRATFHFLTNTKDIETYLSIANRGIAPNGFLIISTFSKAGPEKCSGLAITQYSDTDLKKMFAKYFSNIKCIEEAHSTPWGVRQNFVYCVFKKLGISHGLVEI
jgi:ubiquinone/menaquinone biosynthesis C-methylase UbiE